MGRGRGAGGRARLAGCLLALGVAGPAGAATPDDLDGVVVGNVSELDLDGVVVGNVSELDLDRIRQLADGSDAEPGAVRDAIPGDSEGVVPITLQTAIEVALVNNLQLQIARATRDASAHLVPAARAKFHPTTGFGAGTEGSDLAGDSSRYSALAFLRQEVPTGGSIDLRTDFLRTDISNTTLVDQGAIEVEVRQPLMRGGRTYVARREILDAGYLFEVEDARLEAEILRVTRDAKVAYYDSILAARLIQVTAAAVERDRRLIEASEALFRAARASRRDVVSAQIRLSDDLASLAARRAELREAQLALRDVLGLPLAELVGPAESSVPFRPISLRQGEWVERALRDRPELRELRGLLDAADLQVRVAGNDVLPQLDALGLYRRRDDSGALANAFDLGGQDWSVGLEFAIPFANVAARERLETARQDYRRTERDLERQRREIEREVRSEVIQLRRSLAEVSLQADKVESSRQKLEVAVARYRLGVANNLDITDAQEDLLNAETDLLTAIFDYTNGLARLEASIGGPL
jgi:outer membrane protein TolC